MAWIVVNVSPSINDLHDGLWPSSLMRCVGRISHTMTSALSVAECATAYTWMQSFAAYTDNNTWFLYSFGWYNLNGFLVSAVEVVVVVDVVVVVVVVVFHKCRFLPISRQAQFLWRHPRTVCGRSTINDDGTSPVTCTSHGMWEEGRMRWVETPTVEGILWLIHCSRWCKGMTILVWNWLSSEPHTASSFRLVNTIDD